jgi:mycofactocin system glycosyltransferase
VRLTASAGPGGARNAGVAATSRPFVWFLDADVRVDDARHVASRLRARLEDPCVAAVAARVIGSGGPRVRDQFEVACSPLDLGSSTSLVTAGGAVSYVPSACVMMRREALGSGFDESMRVGEDVDLVWRLRDAGWLVYHDADAVVRHDARDDWPSWLRQRYDYGRSAAALEVRHPGALAPVRVDAWTLATWVALLAGRPRLSISIAASATRLMSSRLPEQVDDRSNAAVEVALGGILRAGGPLARAVTRSYAPVLIGALAVRRVRGPALIVGAAGTLWRMKGRARPTLATLGCSVLDDVAYSIGLAEGALRARSAATIAPRVTWATGGLREALRPSTTTPPPPPMR